RRFAGRCTALRKTGGRWSRDFVQGELRTEPSPTVHRQPGAVPGLDEGPLEEPADSTVRVAAFRTADIARACDDGELDHSERLVERWSVLPRLVSSHDSLTPEISDVSRD